MEPETLFIDFSARKLEQLLARIGECVAKLDREQVWTRSGDHDNAVGNLLLHLSGNLRQWIIAGIGGEPDVRVRDQEFSARGELEPAELMQRLESVCGQAAAVIRGVNPERLMETYQPQNYKVTILEGIYHVVEHFAEHTGQIIFATKLLTGQDLGFYKHLSRPTNAEKTP
jgi:uncharacterized damage-inducible protein DinB